MELLEYGCYSIETCVRLGKTINQNYSIAADDEEVDGGGKWPATRYLNK